MCATPYLAGVRSGIAAADLSSVLPEEVEEEVREAAEISMGTEVRDRGREGEGVKWNGEGGEESDLLGLHFSCAVRSLKKIF